MRYHHRQYPDRVIFKKDKIIQAIKDLGYNTKDFEKEAIALDGKTGKYNGWMDMVRNIMAYDFKDDDGENHLVPAILFDQSDEAKEEQ